MLELWKEQKKKNKKNCFDDESKKSYQEDGGDSFVASSATHVSASFIDLSGSLHMTSHCIGFQYMRNMVVGWFILVRTLLSV